MKTIPLGSRRTGRILTTSFTCKLAAGSYRYFVYATDQAGNHQVKVGVNTLTVSPRVLTSLSAWVSDSTPAQYSDVSAYAKAKDQLGRGISGVKVVFTWHYKTISHSITRSTNANGLATDTRYISGASLGYRVVITVTGSYKGVPRSASTGFTPN